MRLVLPGDSGGTGHQLRLRLSFAQKLEVCAVGCVHHILRPLFVGRCKQRDRQVNAEHNQTGQG